MSTIADLTLPQLAEALHTQRLSIKEVVEHYLAVIDRSPGDIGAFITITAEQALAEADRKQQQLSHATISELPTLFGVPTGIKDLEDTAGVRTTYGCIVTAEHIPTTNAPSVEQLLSTGVISLGKTNAPEFGFPAYTENALTPPASVPGAPDLNVGGSSGGAASAVASGQLPIAPGSDGGGSVRIPAAGAGLVGIKPSRGRIPASTGMKRAGGLVSENGPLAKTVLDAAFFLDAVSQGKIYHATTSWNHPLHVEHFPEGLTQAAEQFEKLPQLRLGWTLESPFASSYPIHVDQQVLDSFQTALKTLESSGHHIEEFHPDYTIRGTVDYPTSFRKVWTSAAATLPLPDEALPHLQQVTQDFIAEGKTLTGAALAQAITDLAVFETGLIEQFNNFDAVLTPTLASLPKPHGFFSNHDTETNYRLQCQYTPYTSMVNVSGLPALTVPTAPVGERQLPTGLHLIGRPGGESTIIALAALIEQSR